MSLTFWDFGGMKGKEEIKTKSRLDGVQEKE